ncbi:MAG: hypothetical protein M1818_005161 [Claussenomyces sp. TS43310]|nr:MAG: hypothetical protein M1818_005161 [Claussenomyces sp. TS43310]
MSVSVQNPPNLPSHQSTTQIEPKPISAETALQQWKIPPGIWSPLCQSRADEVIEEVDGYFLKHWNFPNEKARRVFVNAGFSRVTSLYFPKALDDRIHFACRLLTVLFLIDDLLEDMSFEDGAAYNENLISISRGDVLPDRSIPAEYIMYDLWEAMRVHDKYLADEILEPTFTFMRAQTDRARLNMKELGQYLDYRERDVGKALLSALMRFSMGLHLTKEELASVVSLERNCAKHISIVNDIYSWEKELIASKTGHSEGSALCSAVQVIADECKTSIEASKRVLRAITREWEFQHEELAAERLASPDGCSQAVKDYIKGLEYQMSGNELWTSDGLVFPELQPLYYNYQPFARNANNVWAGLMLLIIVLAICIQPVSKKQKLVSGMPVVGGSDHASIKKQRGRFVYDSKAMLAEGYAKHKGNSFYIPTNAGGRLMIPGKYLEDLKTASIDKVDFVATFTKKQYEAAEKAAIPLLKERANTGDKALDLLYWMSEQAKGTEKGIKFIAGILLKVSFAAIHTNAAAPSQIIYDLCAMPKFVEPLRREINDLLNVDGTIPKSAFIKLARLDSIVKENQRINPLLLSKAQYVASNSTNMSFGFSHHACPARFFAANEIKALIVLPAGQLPKYDIKFAPGQTRPKSFQFETQYLPNHEAKILFKRRKAS